MSSYGIFVTSWLLFYTNKLPTNISLILRRCGDPNYVEHNGMPALCMAIDKFRSPTLVETLLREGANVNQQTFVKAQFSFKSFPQLSRNYGRKLSPLHIALVSRQLSIVRLLLDNGADPNAKTSKGIEALLLICDPYDEHTSDGEALEILKLMVHRGSDINVRDHGQNTLLHRAIMAKNHDMARYLISSGCDVNNVDKDGETPLRFCLGDIRCAKLLLENGANPNAKNMAGNTVYHQVMTSRKSQNDKAEFLQMLHEYNVDPNIRNNQGQTALHLGLEYLDETEIVESILEYGADAKATDNLGRTPAFYLGSFCSTFKYSLGKLSVFTLNKLLNCGINGKRDLDGNPLIHSLAKLCWEKQDPLSFERIMSCIAQAQQTDVNIRDCQNRTALHLVAANLEWEFAQILLNHGADINAMDCDSNTPLHVAIQCKRWKMARNLLLWGFPKSDKEFYKVKDEKCVYPNETSFPRRRSVPNLSWMPECLSVFESIFYLEDNYSSFRRYKPYSPHGMHFDSLTKDFPTPTLSKVISCRINATSLFHTCEEHSVGDFHLAEKCYEEKCLIAKQVFRLVKDLVGKCEELDPRMKCNLLLTGSSAEGTKMWLPDEFDFMMELTELKDQCDLKIKSNLPEVTVRKECRSYWSDLFTEDCSLLSPKKLKNCIYSLLKKAVLSLDRNSYHNLQFNLCFNLQSKDFLQMTKVGVKLSFFWIGEKYKKLLINVDLTPAVPLVLEHFKGEVHERVIGMGLVSVFHVIPHSSKRYNYDIIWRISFSVAELQLVRRMSPKQVSLYKCLKFLRDIHMLNVTEVPSYPLKCCIFDFVFGDGYIDDASFNFNVREILRRLSVYAKAEYYSPHVLRHFFLKDNQLNFTTFDMRWCLSALHFLSDDQIAVLVN